MIIKLKDIPANGKNVEFNLEIESLISRMNSSDYTFSEAPSVKANLVVKGNTVEVKAEIKLEYSTACSRCSQKVKKNLNIPYKIILKPKSADTEELEDVNFGYYLDEKVNCSEISEEYLMLSLPMVVKCERKECVSSGDSWQFGEEIGKNSPFKDIKLH